jgi:hypothetical protein
MIEIGDQKDGTLTIEKITRLTVMKLVQLHVRQLVQHTFQYRAM